jgi:hypothetical protein
MTSKAKILAGTVSTGAVLADGAVGVSDVTGLQTALDAKADGSTASASVGADLKLYEGTDNGTNFVALKAPNALAADVTWTLPDADGTSGQALTTNGTGALSWGSASRWTLNGSDISYSAGNVIVGAANSLRLADADSSNYIGLKAPSTVAANVTYTLPGTDGTNGQLLTTNGSGTLSWATSGASAWLVSGSNIYYTTGNVGIGTTSPATKLHVKGDWATNNGTFVIDGNSGQRFSGLTLQNNGAAKTFFYHDNTDSLTWLGTGVSEPLVFTTNNAERARILSDANPTLRIGNGDYTKTNNIDFFHQYLTPAQSARIQALSGTDYETILRFMTYDGTFGGGGSVLEAFRINRQQEVLIGYTSDNGNYKLQVNSQIFATSATIATSDARYKENVDTLGSCLDVVKALRPVSYTWKPQQDIKRLDDEGNEVMVREAHNFPEGTQVGFIAQEVQQVLADKPWFGSVVKENVRAEVTDKDGAVLAPEEQFYGIAETNLIAILTKAIQEQQAMIEQLKADVAALKGN